MLFAVKLWDTEAAAAQAKPLVANGGVIIPFQNGVESIPRIAAVVGAEHVMGGVAYIAATIAEYVKRESARILEAAPESPAQTAPRRRAKRWLSSSPGRVKA